MKHGFARSALVTLCTLPLITAGTQAMAQQLTHVPFANPRMVGVTLPTALSPELQQVVRARGSTPVENPGGGVAFYAYRDDHPNLLPAPGTNVEARRTEPKKTTYPVLEARRGADANSASGRRFLY